MARTPRLVRVLALALALPLAACVPRGDPSVGDGFRDDFDRTELGPAWRSTGGAYHLVDIKVEVYGDGVSKAEKASYTATSYVVIFGGWSNSKNVLARLDEHGHDRVEGPARKVEKGRTYHMKIERKGDTIRAEVDGQLLVQMVDEDPLWGPGHDHFAFNNWSSELWFDNLKITPL
jgi:hypothetical protein